VAHDPLQFDFAAVSGTNQYNAKPFALVSTVAPPIVAVFRALDEPEPGDGAALGEEPAVLAVLAGDVLPHAAAIRATAAKAAGAHHRLRIMYLRSQKDGLHTLKYVTRGRFVHDPAGDAQAGPWTGTCIRGPVDDGGP
jgi:hypothetical protein